MGLSRSAHIRWLLTVALSSAGFITPVKSQPKLDSRLISLLTAGIDLTLRQEYDKADSLFRVVTLQFPDHPSGFLYQAAVLQARSIDFEAPLEQEKFDSLLEIGTGFSKNLIGKNANSLFGTFFLGTAYGYDAYARVGRGDWFGGVRKGLSAASEFEAVLEKDSTFYDAYAGVGTYYYWKSRKIEFLHWLPFIVDNRPLGIRLLQQCAVKGSLNKFTAMSALISIYLDSGEYQQAEDLSKQALEAYPENRIFLWGLCTALHRMEKFKQASVAYERLLEKTASASMLNPYNEIVCRLNLVQCKLALNDTTQGMEHVKAILSFERTQFPERFQDRAKAKFSEARALIPQLSTSSEKGR